MADGKPFTELLERYHSLGSADRKAVLDNFDASDRMAFEAAAVSAAKAQEEEQLRQLRADRQYAGYSPWLGDLVEAATLRTQAADHLTDAGKKALMEAHRELCEKSDTQPIVPGWRLFLKQLFSFEPQAAEQRS